MTRGHKVPSSTPGSADHGPQPTPTGSIRPSRPLPAMAGAGDHKSKALLRAVANRDLAGLQAALSAPQTPQLVFQGLPALHVAALRDWAPGVTALLGAGEWEDVGSGGGRVNAWERPIVLSAPCTGTGTGTGTGTATGPAALFLQAGHLRF